ncbi:MAG: hypothetical protein ACFCA4_08245 [Cyanophyceae cyanobacterium]
MSEFKGTVSLDKPFLEQPEIAEFLEFPEDLAFPRAILNRLIVIIERFILDDLRHEYSTSAPRLAGLQLICEFSTGEMADDGEDLENENRWVHRTGWVSRPTLEPDHETLNSTERWLLHEKLNRLNSRCHECVVARALRSHNEKLRVATAIDVDFLISESDTGEDYIVLSRGLEGSGAAGEIETVIKLQQQTSCCVSDNGTPRDQPRQPGGLPTHCDTGQCG